MYEVGALLPVAYGSRQIVGWGVIVSGPERVGFPVRNYDAWRVLWANDGRAEWCTVSELDRKCTVKP